MSGDLGAATGLEAASEQKAAIELGVVPESKGSSMSKGSSLSKGSSISIWSGVSGTLPGVHVTEENDATGAREVSGVRASEAEVHSVQLRPSQLVLLPDGTSLGFQP